VKTFCRIGNTENDIDRSIDDAVKSMYLAEKSSFTLRIRINSKKNNLGLANDEVWIRLDCTLTLEQLEDSIPIHKWLPAKKFETAKMFKMAGVDLFGQKRYYDAFLAFRQALTLIR
jgi:hypothetical protein